MGDFWGLKVNLWVLMIVFSRWIIVIEVFLLAGPQDEMPSRKDYIEIILFWSQGYFLRPFFGVGRSTLGSFQLFHQGKRYDAWGFLNAGPQDEQPRHKEEWLINIIVELN